MSGTLQDGVLLSSGGTLTLPGTITPPAGFKVANDTGETATRSTVARDKAERDALFAELGSDETGETKRPRTSEGESSTGRGRKKPARDAREVREAVWAEWT